MENDYHSYTYANFLFKKPLLVEFGKQEPQYVRRKQ